MNMDIKQLDRQYVAPTYARFDVSITDGQGSVVYDEAHKEYIDLSSGIAVNTFGICDKGWVDAVTAQLCRVAHTSNLYYNAPCAELAQRLCERTGMKKVFFSNSGAEANECAIKVARKYAAEHKGAAYYHIITLQNSFHGRTLATLTATGQEIFHKDFLPLVDGFLYAPANDAQALEALLKENKCAAIMLEVVQGEGGVIALDAEYLQAVSALAKQYDVLLICDEVQIGNGRSGKLYGYMHFNLSPDIVSTAKGLAGGLPLGATLLSEKTEHTLTPGTHGSTFGGNPVSCAAANYVLSRLDEATLAGVSEREALIRRCLDGAPGVKSVTGLGLMLGIETERDAAEVVCTCMKNGVLVLKAKNKVRLLPALNIPMDLLKKAMDILCAACMPT